jgi:hypothetical protein
MRDASERLTHVSGGTGGSEGAGRSPVSIGKSAVTTETHQSDANTTKARRNHMALFWNATGATLSNDFKGIGNELSNLRIVG